jgi:hypothetical protein
MGSHDDGWLAPAPTRTPCIIAGCKRSRKPYKYKELEEWICQKHWRTIEVALREKHKRNMRLYRKFLRRRREPHWHTQARFFATWQLCKQTATIADRMGNMK